MPGGHSGFTQFYASHLKDCKSIDYKKIANRKNSRDNPRSVRDYGLKAG